MERELIINSVFFHFPEPVNGVSKRAKIDQRTEDEDARSHKSGRDRSRSPLSREEDANTPPRSPAAAQEEIMQSAARLAAQEALKLTRSPVRGGSASPIAANEEEDETAKAASPKPASIPSPVPKQNGHGSPKMPVTSSASVTNNIQTAALAALQAAAAAGGQQNPMQQVNT